MRVTLSELYDMLYVLCINVRCLICLHRYASFKLLISLITVLVLTVFHTHRHTSLPASDSDIYYDIDQSLYHTRHCLYSVHMECYSQCRSSDRSKLKHVLLIYNRRHKNKQKIIINKVLEKKNNWTFIQKNNFYLLQIARFFVWNI